MREADDNFAGDDYTFLAINDSAMMFRIGQLFRCLKKITMLFSI